MKLKLLIVMCTLPMLASAQTFQVGDSVRVRKTAETYLTGELISPWVYNVALVVSQVGSQQYPTGILLDTLRACSWVDQKDVMMAGSEEIAAPVPVTPAPVEKPKVEEKPVTPVVKPAPEPVVDPVPEPVVDPVPEPVVAPAPEPVVEPVPEPVVAPAPEPVVTPAPKPVVAPAPAKEISEVKAHKASVEVAENTITNATFQLFGDMGILLGNNTYGLFTDVIAGARLNSYVFVGGGLGLHGWLSGNAKNGASALMFPIYAEARGYLPLSNQKVTPFMELALGTSIGVIDKQQTDKLNKKVTAGFYTRIGAGVEFNSWSISLGYDYGPASNAWLGWAIMFSNDK